MIVAHENVRKRLSTDQLMPFFKRKVPASPKEALPVITFSRDIAFHLNGEEIKIVHLSNAHTDGDAAIFFTKANVVHTGDVYFEGLYPFIDTDTDGSIDGMIKASEKIISMIDDDTKIITGHGPLSTTKKFKAYVAMLTSIRDNVHTLIKKGSSLEEVQAAKPTQNYDAKWGGGVLKPDQFTALVYSDLKRF